jgi:N-acetylglutamate synthase-like GNAT family acetyltransferase
VTRHYIRKASEQDAGWVRDRMLEWWGGTTVVTRGRVHEPERLPGFVAEEGEVRIGLVTYCVAEGRADCEIVTLNSVWPRMGIGTKLVDVVWKTAREIGCKRLWLVTTNDNLEALRFYQKRGFVLAALHRDAIRGSRALKPTIPQLGNDGIPIRDEVELEMRL